MYDVEREINSSDAFDSSSTSAIFSNHPALRFERESE